MRRVSNKQKEANKRIKQAYKVLRDTKPQYCTGCGRADVPLSHSHLIPRSRRKDLEADVKNITYHCLTMGDRKGCHDIWESRDKDKLLDYYKNMEYILEVDTEYYFILTELNA